MPYTVGNSISAPLVGRSSAPVAGRVISPERPTVRSPTDRSRARQWLPVRSARCVAAPIDRLAPLAIRSAGAPHRVVVSSVAGRVVGLGWPTIRSPACLLRAPVVSRSDRPCVRWLRSIRLHRSQFDQRTTSREVVGSVTGASPRPWVANSSIADLPAAFVPVVARSDRPSARRRRSIRPAPLATRSGGDQSRGRRLGDEG
jgi:hypothetical protein